MADSVYMAGRSKYARPQAIVWADAYETSNAKYVPSGTEFDDFLILSDHNRSEISIQKQRIENRKRMINGTMRSYHIADKKTYSWSWDMFPSRAFSNSPVFSASGQLTNSVEDYVVDLAAGGVDLIDWYENHQGPFYMLLAYDKYNKFNVLPYQHLNEYNEVVQVYFSSCESSIIKRGGTNHDFWNISVTLEEA